MNWLAQKLDQIRNNYRIVDGPLNLTTPPLVIGLLRERNEALVLKDTLDHLSQFVDGIVIYDDASTDNSVQIAAQHPAVLHIIVNKTWQTDRAKEETRNRHILLESARQYSPDWFMYADADERFEGNIKDFLSSPKSDNIDGIRISLFDAYLTKSDHQPYKEGPMLNLRSSFGPERRDIIMIWRNTPSIHYAGVDAREPIGLNETKVITKFYCQHYGKALSEQQWEDTCDYYSQHFPMYSKKWQARKGKAIHNKSDFDRPLYSWEKVKDHAIKIHPQ